MNLKPMKAKGQEMTSSRKIDDLIKARGFDVRPYKEVFALPNPLKNYVEKDRSSFFKITDLFKWLPKIIKYIDLIIDIIKYIESKLKGEIK